MRRIKCSARDFFRLVDLMGIVVGMPDDRDDALVISSEALAWPDDYPYISVTWFVGDCMYLGVLSNEYDDFWNLFLQIETNDGQLILVCNFEVPLSLIADCEISVYEP